ncbi:MAG: starch-binding protein [Acutalibacteraceae bacterium]|nr:starch-binding protein [Acutalibacteraceae bacterium]
MKQTKKQMLAVSKRALSAILVFLMLVSIFPAANITVSAAGRFVYYKNTNGGSKVCAYAWDRNNGNQKHLGDWPGTDMQRVGNSAYYKIEVNPAANWIIFNGGTDSWQTDDLQLPTGNNPVYENGTWKVNFNENTLSCDEIIVSDSYDAETGCNFGQGIFAANATYFDYMSDEEISNGYLKPMQAGTGFYGAEDDWYPFYKFNRTLMRVVENNGAWREPLYFGNFCNVGGAYWDHDGNRVNDHGGDFVNATNGDNVKNFWYVPNNSNREYINQWNVAEQIGINSPNEAVQGLVQNRLKNGSLMATDSLKMPYFDTDFLRKKYDDNGYVNNNGHRIANVYKSYFPFVEEKHGSYSTYRFDSEGARDNVYFTWNGKTPTSVNYGAGTGYGVEDGLKYFMSESDLHKDGIYLPKYGIFPFNNKSSNNRGYRDGYDNLDYGFGIRIDIDFKVTDTGTLDGTSNGQPIMFEFSGDDDIWVFLSDDNGNENLVLDLGGNHKMASGRINFKTMKATADRVYNRNGGGSLYDQNVTFNGGKHLSSNKVYHMTVFYMERGLIESNFKMNFSFYPVDNLFTTNKIVDTTDVNNGIKEAVANADTFTITNKANGSEVANKEFTLDGDVKTTSSSGSYGIKNGQTASFTNIAKVGSELELKEDIPSDSIFKYSTSYTVTDVENAVKVASGNGLTTDKFIFKNTVTARQTTNFNVTYTNKPATSSVSLTKKAVKAGSDEAYNTDMSFPFTVLLDLDGDPTDDDKGLKYDYKAYPLQYSISGEAGTYNTSKNGGFSIKAGQTIVFDGIPVGASYKFVEKANDDVYTTEYPNNTVGGTITENSSGDSVIFKNSVISDPSFVNLSASKLLDGQSDFKQTFSFTLQEVEEDGSKIGTAQTKQNVNKTEQNAGNVIEFDSIEIGIKEENSDFTLNNIYVYVNGATDGSVMQKVDEGVYEKTFTNLSAQDSFTYSFGANNTDTLKWDSKGNFNGDSNESLSIVAGSKVTLQIDVSDFNFSDNSGDVTVTRTVTTPDKTSDSVYLDNKAGWATPHIHYWKSGDPNSTAWPGKKMEHVSGSIYKWDVPAGMVGVVFNAGPSPQTGDLTVRYGYTYNNLTNTWSSEPVVLPGTSSTTTNTANHIAGTYEYSRYFEIAEVPDVCTNTNAGDSFVYDSNKYYAAVKISQTGLKITTSTKYYKTLDDAVKANAEGAISDVIFHNYHDKGKMTITKVDNNGKPINDDVKFALYKVGKDGDNISGLTPVATKDVVDGIAVFDNLDVYASEGNCSESNYQWYCVVEIEAKDGYIVNSTKHYFMIPEVTEAKGSEHDFEINNKKYSYVLKNGEKIFDIKYRVVNAPLFVPNASGFGTTGFIYTGLSIILIGATFFGVEMLTNRKKRRTEFKS